MNPRYGNKSPRRIIAFATFDTVRYANLFMRPGPKWSAADRVVPQSCFGAFMQLFAGELTAAGFLIEEVQAATEATGSNLAG